MWRMVKGSIRRIVRTRIEREEEMISGVVEKEI